MNVLGSLVSMVILLLLIGPVISFFPILSILILKKPCLWLIKHLNDGVTEKKAEKQAYVFSSIIVLTVFYNLSLPVIVDMINGDQDTISAILILIGIIVFAFVYKIMDLQSKITSLYAERSDLRKQIEEEKKKEQMIIEAYKIQLDHEKELRNSGYKERFCGTPYLQHSEENK